MAAITPVQFTPVHQEETQANGPGNEQTLQKLAQNCNMLGALYPLGTILTLNTNQPGSPALDTNVWQLCDGSQITNPLSPLRTIGLSQRFTPNIHDKHVKFIGAGGGNPQGGSYTIPFNHSHGGSTNGGNAFTINAYDDDKDNSKPYANGAGHQHSIGGNGDITVEYPESYKVAAYMRIQ